MSLASSNQQQHHCLHRCCLALIRPLHPPLPTHRVHPDTLCAIFAQENQYKVLKSHHIHKANMDAYCAR